MRGQFKPRYVDGASTGIAGKFVSRSSTHAESPALRRGADCSLETGIAEVETRVGVEKRLDPGNSLWASRAGVNNAKSADLPSTSFPE